ncbi:hypothetical protein LSH36_282g02005 [Paralvinella palmiformis]|uniref:Uncharacterized protein n=1 Tax=Paralvinella palmiformis TaxID=53620 RepID=A0AAD9N3A6_9ANNE|nr:hypothetical protein LSH36_282g02005 [Paralvinella palmiformis]
MGSIDRTKVKLEITEDSTLQLDKTDNILLALRWRRFKFVKTLYSWLPKNMDVSHEVDEQLYKFDDITETVELPGDDSSRCGDKGTLKTPTLSKQLRISTQIIIFGTKYQQPIKVPAATAY